MILDPDNAAVLNQSLSLRLKGRKLSSNETEIFPGRILWTQTFLVNQELLDWHFLLLDNTLIQDCKWQCLYLAIISDQWDMREGNNVQTHMLFQLADVKHRVDGSGVRQVKLVCYFSHTLNNLEGSIILRTKLE